MNKLGIKVYGNDIFKIDGISYYVNSINHHTYNKATKSKHKFRLIDRKYFSIRLRIKFKRDE